jgi:hypothetical protein
MAARMADRVCDPFMVHSPSIAARPRSTDVRQV